MMTSPKEGKKYLKNDSEKLFARKEAENRMEQRKLDCLIMKFEYEFKMKERDIQFSQRQLFREKVFTRENMPRYVRPKSSCSVSSMVAVAETKEWLEKTQAALRMVPGGRRDLIGLFSESGARSRHWRSGWSTDSRKSLSLDSLPIKTPRSNSNSPDSGRAPTPDFDPEKEGGGILAPYRHRSFTVAECGRCTPTVAGQCKGKAKLLQGTYHEHNHHPLYKRAISDSCTKESPRKEPVTGRSRSVTFTEETESSHKRRLQRTPTPYWFRGELLKEDSIHGEDHDIACDTEVSLVSMRAGDCHNSSRSSPVSLEPEHFSQKREAPLTPLVTTTDHRASPLLRRVIEGQMRHIHSPPATPASASSMSESLSSQPGSRSLCDPKLLTSLTDSLPAHLYGKATENARRVVEAEGVLELRQSMIEDSQAKANGNVLRDPRWKNLEASLTKPK